MFCNSSPREEIGKVFIFDNRSMPASERSSDGNKNARSHTLDIFVVTFSAGENGAN